MNQQHSTLQALFVMSILVLFALVVAWGICKLIGWAYRKMFGPHPDDHYSL